MLLTEFLVHFNTSMLSHGPEHDKYVPPVWHSLIVENAESKRPWNDSYGPDESFFGHKDVIDYDSYREMIGYKVGGLCAWVDKNGVIYPIGYACHDFAREALIPRDDKMPHVKLENRAAHVSFGEKSFEKMTNYVQEAFLTKKMTHSVLRFCWNVRRHPLVEEYRKEFPFHEPRIPYPWVDPLVEEINRNAQRERDLITLYSDEERAYLFNNARVRNDISQFHT